MADNKIKGPDLNSALGDRLLRHTTTDFGKSAGAWPNSEKRGPWPNSEKTGPWPNSEKTGPWPDDRTPTTAVDTPRKWGRLRNWIIGKSY